MRSLFLVILFCFNLSAAFAEESEFSQVLQIEKAWVKLAPPNASVNAAYLVLRNPSGANVTVAEVAADCCGHVMLHETRITGDQAAMHHLDELIIPFKSRIIMRPGGLHLMLVQSKTPLTIDAKVIFVLTFADGRKQQLEAIVSRDE